MRVTYEPGKVYPIAVELDAANFPVKSDVERCTHGIICPAMFARLAPPHWRKSRCDNRTSSSRVGSITLDTKQAGKPSAGKQAAGFDEAGTGPTHGLDIKALSTLEIRV